ncbi:MAG: hypothetical protein M3209_17105 [Acidobacteriota bacterium]|nr:hypothetical protein [Acidobacteriota bacterium]
MSRPTLRKCRRHFQQKGIAGLEDLSRRPHNSPKRKVLEVQIFWVSGLRKRRLGSRRIQNDLLKTIILRFLAPLSKVPQKLKAPTLRRSRIPGKSRFRYERPIQASAFKLILAGQIFINTQQLMIAPESEF